MSTDLLPLIAEAVLALPGLAVEEHPDRYGTRSLTATWLGEFTSVHTRRAYFKDLVRLLTWCEREGTDPLKLRPADITRFKATLTGGDSAINRQMSACSSWYSWLIRNGADTTNPFSAVKRPKVDKDESTTTGLTVPEVKLMLAVAKELVRQSADFSFRRRIIALRDEALLRVLADMGLRVAEVCNLDLDSLSHKQGHRTLRYTGKGNKTTERPVPAHSLEAVHTYLPVRGDAPGPLFITVRPDGSYGRLDTKQVFNTVKRIARLAGLPHGERISPHSWRHAFATNSLDAGVPLHHVQDGMGHADPRTTRRYDRGRRRLANDPALVLGTVYTDDEE